MIRVLLPTHLQRLAQSGREVQVQIEGAPTYAAVIDALEGQYPALRGTIRDYATNQRRPFVRFFACGEDTSHLGLEERLPEEIVNGSAPLWIVGAMAGG
jgi:hypothetical protein